MSRFAHSPATIHYSFGPGPWSPAIKWIIIANAAMFLVRYVVGDTILNENLGLTPRLVVEQQRIWQPVTYLFLHGGVFHLLFNMLGLWMFGVELERMWGTRTFLKYYAIAGVGAGLTVLAVGLSSRIDSLAYPWTTLTYLVPTIGASGALYGVLMAYAFYFPDRPLLLFMLFPIPAKYFVMIIGAIAFLSAPQSQSSEPAHLGGLLVGYLYLRGGRGGLAAEIKYRYFKWKMNRLRRKFDVYSGGRSDWDRHVH